jgi:hypothetical protein
MEGEVDAKSERRAWWSTRRVRYNVTLLFAAPISLVSMLAVWGLFKDWLPCFEITAVSIVLGGILFLPGLAVANVCYFLGPLGERLLRPRNPALFRRGAFAAGMALSLSLIFAPAVGTLTLALLRLPCTDEFGDRHVPGLSLLSPPRSEPRGSTWEVTTSA